MAMNSDRLARVAAGLVFGLLVSIPVMKPGMAGVPTIDEFSALAKDFGQGEAKAPADKISSEDKDSSSHREGVKAIDAGTTQGRVFEDIRANRLEFVLSQEFHKRIAVLEELEQKLKAAQNIEVDGTIYDVHIALEDMAKLKEQALAAAIDAVKDIEVIVDSDMLLQRVMAAMDMRDHFVDIKGNLVSPLVEKPEIAPDSSEACREGQG